MYYFGRTSFISIKMFMLFVSEPVKVWHTSMISLKNMNRSCHLQKWYQRNLLYVKKGQTYLDKKVMGSPTVLHCQVIRCTWGCCVLPTQNLTHSCIGSCRQCCTASREWLRLEWVQECHMCGWAGLKFRRRRQRKFFVNCCAAKFTNQRYRKGEKHKL